MSIPACPQTQQSSGFSPREKLPACCLFNGSEIDPGSQKSSQDSWGALCPASPEVSTPSPGALVRMRSPPHSRPDTSVTSFPSIFSCPRSGSYVAFVIMSPWPCHLGRPLCPSLSLAVCLSGRLRSGENPSDVFPWLSHTFWARIQRDSLCQAYHIVECMVPVTPRGRPIT